MSRYKLMIPTTQVEQSLELIDKNCLDSIRVMPSPPSMVNSIMMIFVKMLQSEKKLPEELSAPQVITGHMCNRTIIS